MPWTGTREARIARTLPSSSPSSHPSGRTARSDSDTAPAPAPALYPDPMTALLCLDLGTSAVKAAVLDVDGTLIAAGTAEYPTTTFPAGGAEQCPVDWVRAARTAITRCLPTDARIAALSLTGQMQDLVLESDPPGSGPAGAVRPAILYTDLRAAADAQAIRRTLEDSGHDWDELTGNVQDAGSCAAMHRRLARLEPDVAANTGGITFGPAGHLAFVLGAGLHCDPTTASTTGLLDARRREWSPDIARAAGLDPGLLPRLTRAAGEVVGETDARAHALIGLPAGIPIVLAPGDAGASTLGVSGPATGRDHASLGTSGWIASVRSLDDGSAAHPASHRLALAGDDELRISAVLAAGAAAAWARDAYLGGIDPAGADRLLTERAGRRGRAPSGLLVLPSISGERFPVRDASLRGAVLGIDASTRPEDLYAATLEGVALALSHALPRDGTREVLPVVGGGARSAPWRRILADVTGCPVLAVDAVEATVIGAAIAGAEAVGLRHGIVPLADRGGEVTTPDELASARFAAVQPRHRELYDLAARCGTAVPVPRSTEA